MARRMHRDEVPIDAELVRVLLDEQFPAWRRLPLRPVEPWGTDHAIWRLGDDLVVRLPRIGWATEQAVLEATWLPRLAPHVPVAVPTPVALGDPGRGYPFRWAVHRWLQGELAAPETIIDPRRFAEDLGAAILGLRSAPTDGAPPPRGRARPLRDLDGEVRAAIGRADHVLDAEAATVVWDEALAAPEHDGEPVWVHGDLDGNCLVTDGRLSGLLDWGSLCVGDPAADVKIIWSPLIGPDDREHLVDRLGADEATVARSRGLVIHQAAMALPYYLHTYPSIVERARHQLAAIGVGAPS